MPDVFVCAPLGPGVDATAVRSGDDVLVHVSPVVPRWARPATADHLYRVMRAAEGKFAAVTLAPGEALQIAQEPAIPLQRRTSAGKFMLAAAVVIPLGLAAVLVCTQAEGAEAPITARVATAPGVPGPATPAPAPDDPVDDSTTADAVEETPVRAVTAASTQDTPAPAAAKRTPAPPPAVPTQRTPVEDGPPATDRACASNPSRHGIHRRHHGHRRDDVNSTSRPDWTVVTDLPEPQRQVA